MVVGSRRNPRNRVADRATHSRGGWYVARPSVKQLSLLLPRDVGLSEQCELAELVSQCQMQPTAAKCFDRLEREAYKTRHRRGFGEDTEEFMFRRLALTAAAL